MNIGQAIRTLRTQRNMTQTELAEKVGMSVNAVSSWELGKSYPPMGSIKRICNVFGTSENYLFLVAADGKDLPEDLRTIYRAFLETLSKPLVQEDKQ